jgi:hypothetical protein
MQSLFAIALISLITPCLCSGKNSKFIEFNQNHLKIEHLLPVEWSLFKKYHPPTIEFVDFVKSIVKSDLIYSPQFEYTFEKKAKICLEILPFAKKADAKTRLIFRAKTEPRYSQILKEGNEIGILKEAGFSFSHQLLVPDQTNLITWGDFENSLSEDYKNLFTEYLAIVLQVCSASFLQYSMKICENFVQISRLYGPLRCEFWWFYLALGQIKQKHRSILADNFEFFRIFYCDLEKKHFNFHSKDFHNPPPFNFIKALLKLMLKFCEIECLDVININLTAHIDEFNALLKSNNNIKALHLRRTRLKLFDFDFSRLPNLQSLIIQDNMIINVPKNLPSSLKVLNLESNNIEFTTASFLSQLKHLEILNLNGNTFRSRFLEEIYLILHLNPKLRYLGLIHHNIPKRQMNTFKALHFKHSIKQLENLETLFITIDDNLSDLLQEKYFLKLENLVIKCIKVKFNSWKALGQLNSLKNLYILSEFEINDDLWDFLRKTKAKVRFYYILKDYLVKAQNLNSQVSIMKSMLMGKNFISLE